MGKPIKKLINPSQENDALPCKLEEVPEVNLNGEVSLTDLNPQELAFIPTDYVNKTNGVNLADFLNQSQGINLLSFLSQLQLAHDKGPSIYIPPAVQDPKIITVKDAYWKFLYNYIYVHLKKNTIKQYISIFQRFICPAFGQLDINSVSHEHIFALHYSESKNPYQANRIKAISSKFFNWCYRNGLKRDDKNPTKYINNYKEHRQLLFLDQAQLNKIWNVINQLLKENKIKLVPATALKLLMLTGARKNEILNLQWSSIDFVAKRAIIEECKNG
ncbi:MAG: tyrosine-type recombinase/integrase, partial [Deltaproteobacteria bacterium]|nr:tyrosine-type recombinase/integrase [Deltaproteobacteria bacterium]